MFEGWAGGRSGFTVGDGGLLAEAHPSQVAVVSTVDRMDADPRRSEADAATDRGQEYLSNVVITTYKSIRYCNVSIGPVTFLVGRNGAGKSNFIDALKFVHDAINTNLESAVTTHGSPGSLRTVGTSELSIELLFQLDTRSADYAVALTTPENAFEVTKEHLTIISAEGETTSIDPPIPEASSRRTLSLAVSAAHNDDARAVYDRIRSMRFYDFSIPAIRAPQTPSQGELLRPDGGNLASVLGRLQQVDAIRFARLQQYMAEILPGIKTVHREFTGPSESIMFEMAHGVFWTHHMSSGTLLALAVLVALFQPPDANDQKTSLIALEEPERSLHPAAVGILLDAITEASSDRQIMVATQSPDLLDRSDLPPNSILAVVAGGPKGSDVGRVDKPSMQALQSHLFTAGELVRLDQLQPDDETSDR